MSDNTTEIEFLINKQFEFYGIDAKYKDILNVDDWYLKWEVPREEEIKFKKWLVDWAKKEKRKSADFANNLADYFILMWGLKTKD